MPILAYATKHGEYKVHGIWLNRGMGRCRGWGWDTSTGRRQWRKGVRMRPHLQVDFVNDLRRLQALLQDVLCEGGGEGHGAIPRVTCSHQTELVQTRLRMEEIPEI